MISSGAAYIYMVVNGIAQECHLFQWKDFCTYTHKLCVVF